MENLDKNIVDFIDFLESKNLNESAKNLTDITKEFTATDILLLKVLEELKEVNKRIESTDTKATPEISNFKASINKLGENLKSAKTKMSTLKSNFYKVCETAVSDIKSNFKDNKTIMANATLEFLKVQKGVNALRVALAQDVININKNIDVIKAVSEETNFLKQHFKNLGNAIVGKQREDITRNHENKLETALIKLQENLLELDDKFITIDNNLKKLSKNAKNIKNEKSTTKESIVDEAEVDVMQQVDEIVGDKFSIEKLTKLKEQLGIEESKKDVLDVKKAKEQAI